ncbi:hypothetical protein B0H14DRAFT_3702875, partial [Mycena olivaceomarginata]
QAVQHPHPPHPPHPQYVQPPPQPPTDTPTRKRACKIAILVCCRFNKIAAKAPSVRRACTACHAGKTRCSESLPNCLKRGLGNVCAYPDESEPQHDRAAAPGTSLYYADRIVSCAAPVYAAAPQTAGMTLSHQQYYDYNGAFTGASSSTFRPAKRPRTLTDEETAAITRNFSRGDFFVGNSAPVRIDPRLPVRLTLGEGDHVHFNVGNYEGAT